MPVSLSKPRPLILAVAIAATALLAVLYGITAARVHAPPEALKPLVLAAKPEALPLVGFVDAQGRRHTLAEFKGRYVLLNLWAPWCAPCVRELPALAGLQGALPGRLRVVAVDVGRGTAADAAAFLASHDAAALTPYVDSDTAFMRVFGVFGLPMSILIDDKGHEIARASGPAEWNAPSAIAYFKAITR